MTDREHFEPRDTLTDAFMDDPGFAWVCRDPNRRRRQLDAIMAGSISHARRRGGVVTLDQGRAVGVWVPDDRSVIGLSDAIRGGMILMPLRLGPTTMRRLDVSEKEGHALVVEHAPTPHAYLMVLGVHPGRQGRGLAREVVDAVEAQAQTAGFETLALRTENPANVGLYRHLGFELHEQTPAPTSGVEVAVFSKAIRPTP